MAISSDNSRFVLTGGPGAGKTTVLDTLRARGSYCVQEVARAVIKTRLHAGLPPRPDPVEFAKMILETDRTNYNDTPDSQNPCFFDRGVVDALGMLYQAGACSDGDLAEMLRQYPYNFCVFIFPPWEEIYKADEERDQTFAEAVGVFNSLKFWYTKCGYHPVEVPCGSVRERADFIQRMASDVLCRV